MKLMDEVLSKDNLNQAYLQVTRNKGASGVDDMTCEEVKDYLKVHGNDLINQIKSREYKPLPVRSGNTKAKWWSKKIRNTYCTR